MKGPCKNCTKRHELCHSSCKEYAEWKKHLEKAKENRDLFLRTYKWHSFN